MSDKKEKIRLKGHETFILREGWLTKGLHGVRDNPHIFSENYGADALGVGTNMAKAIRYWLREGGLIRELPRQPIELTEIGDQIYENDPYLEDDFALWLVHIHLAENRSMATSWYIFFNCLEADEFTREELPELMKRQILIETGHADISMRSLNDDCVALLNMYGRSHVDNYDPEDKSISPFAKFGLIRKDGNRYRRYQPDTKRLHEFVVLYMLQKYFAENKCEGVSIGDLLTKANTPGKILNLNRTTLNDYLDILENKEYIRITRTAGLDMVYRQCDWNANQVVEEYYKIL